MYFYFMETKKIWNQYSDELRGYLIKKTGDKNLAEDILQEAFIKVHLKISELRSSHLLRVWLYRICDNTLTDHYRKQVHPEPVESTVAEEEPDSHSAENCLLPLIEQLPEKYQKALLLSEIKGLKQNRVAEILGITISGAKSRIQRGRKLLQEGFIDCCDYTLNEKGVLVGECKPEKECKVCS